MGIIIVFWGFTVWDVAREREGGGNRRQKQSLLRYFWVEPADHPILSASGRETDQQGTCARIAKGWEQSPLRFPPSVGFDNNSHLETPQQTGVPFHTHTHTHTLITHRESC